MSVMSQENAITVHSVQTIGTDVLYVFLFQIDLFYDGEVGVLQTQTVGFKIQIPQTLGKLLELSMTPFLSVKW